MVLGPTLQYFSNQFLQLTNNGRVSLTIANAHHVIESSERCTCYLCLKYISIHLSDNDRHSMLQIIGSCGNFELNDPIEFLICALQSSYLNKLSKLKQFVHRYSIISSQIASTLMDNVQNSMPTILRTDILLHTIFNFVGGDYFISLCKYTEENALMSEEHTLLLSGHGDTNLTLHSIHYIALVDCFGNLLIRLSGYFRCPDWSFVYMDDHDATTPSVFTFIGDKIFRWKLNETMNISDRLLSLDVTFQHRSGTAFDHIFGSRYWNYNDVSHGICVWESNIYIVSEEHQHIANGTSSEYLLKICILQLDPWTGDVLHTFEFDMDHHPNQCNNDYDFLIAPSEWLLSEKQNTQRTYCFVLFHRNHGIINFIDPLNCTVSRKIKTNQATETKIMFVKSQTKPQIIGYSMSNQLVIMVDLKGDVIQHIYLPFGDGIQFVALSDAYIYVDVSLLGDANTSRYLPVPFQQIVSDDDTEEWQETQNRVKLKWFSNSCWRYILDIRNLNILALFSIKPNLRYSKLFYHVNPAKFHF